MQAVLQVFSKPPVRSYWLEVISRLNKREQNVNVFMKKVIPRNKRLIWSVEK